MGWAKNRVAPLSFLTVFTVCTVLLLIAMFVPGILVSPDKMGDGNGNIQTVDTKWVVGTTQACFQESPTAETKCKVLDSNCHMTQDEPLFDTPDQQTEKARTPQDGGIMGKVMKCEYHKASSIMLYIAMASVGIAAALQVVALFICCVNIVDILTVIAAAFSVVLMGSSLTLWLTIPSAKHLFGTSDNPIGVPVPPEDAADLPPPESIMFPQPGEAGFYFIIGPVFYVILTALILSLSACVILLCKRCCPNKFVCCKKRSDQERLNDANLANVQPQKYGHDTMGF